jgi:hypothetical protein
MLVTQMCVLEPMKVFTEIIQGTHYVTVSLVIPMVCRLVEQLHPDSPVLNDDMEPMAIAPFIQEARAFMYADVVQRWFVTLDQSKLEDYCVATALDPRFKNFIFSTLLTKFDNGKLTLKRAQDMAAYVYRADYAPKATVDVVASTSPYVDSGDAPTSIRSKHFL